MATTDASDRQDQQDRQDQHDRQGGTTSGDARVEGRVRDAGELLRVAGSLAAVRAEVDQLEALDDDDSVRARLATLERFWHGELEEILPPSEVAELHRLTDWTREAASGAEVRVALAQLAGWLDGLISAMGFIAAPDQQVVVPEQ